MAHSTRIPIVFILRQAMDVIRREALKFDVETGGILIGTRSKDGAILVTHATPPGPAAIHNAIYFQRDVAFQQAALTNLNRRYNVQYLGEWHKNPRGLPVPSSGDFVNVKKLLADPDYGVNDLLFPIIICEQDLGFQIHFFYIATENIQAGFLPIAWHELTLSIDSDWVFCRPASVSPLKPAVLSACTENQEGPSGRAMPCRSAQAKAWSSLEKILPFCHRTAETAQAVNEHKRDAPGQLKEESQMVPATLWYETESGRKRLAHEQRLLQSFGLSTQPFTISDNSLCFSFPRGCGREIVAICTSDHPNTPPLILLRDAPGAKHHPLDFSGWSSSEDYLADLIVPLLGPIIDV